MLKLPVHDFAEEASIMPIEIEEPVICANTRHRDDEGESRLGVAPRPKETGTPQLHIGKRDSRNRNT